MRTVMVSMLFNLALAIGKTIAGSIGHSYALIADGIESMSDVFSSLVVYVGLRIARKPPDENHPYGHGKAEPMAASVVALALFGAAAVIFSESLREMLRPHRTPAPFTLIVLALVVVIKETLFRYVGGVGNAVESTAVKTDAWHHRSDAITSATGLCRDLNCTDRRPRLGARRRYRSDGRRLDHRLQRLAFVATRPL